MSAPAKPARAQLREVGHSGPKLDAWAKVTGRAIYVDDIPATDMLHGRTVRSTIARGRIRKVEFDPTFDWSAVTIVDWRDIPGENVVALIENDQPLLARDEVRHQDEAIVLLAHADPEHLLEAVKHVHIEYDPLEPVLTIADALAVRQRLFGDDNVFKTIHIERGDTAAGLAGSDLVVEGTYRFGHQEHIYIENNGMIAERTPTGGLHVRGSLQCPYYVHKALCRAFALTGSQVRVTQTVTGGGFGGKEEYPSMIAGHACLLAWKSGRPVRLMYDRLEDIAATTKRHPGEIHIRAGVMRDGTLVALESYMLQDKIRPLQLAPAQATALPAIEYRSARCLL